MDKESVTLFDSHEMTPSWRTNMESAFHSFQTQSCNLTVKRPRSKNTCQLCHIAYPGFLWFSENRPPCSHSFLLSTFWQILTSLECLSGHPRTLLTVYGLTRVHVQTLWWCSVRYFMLLQFQVPLPAGYWWVVESSSNHWALSTTAVSFFSFYYYYNSL